MSKLKDQIIKSEELIKEQTKQLMELREVTVTIQVRVDTKPDKPDEENKYKLMQRLQKE